MLPEISPSTTSSSITGFGCSGREASDASMETHPKAKTILVRTRQFRVKTTILMGWINFKTA